VVVIGPDELAAGEVTLRDMSSKEESRVAFDTIVSVVTTVLT